MPLAVIASSPPISLLMIPLGATFSLDSTIDFVNRATGSVDEAFELGAVDSRFEVTCDRNYTAMRTHVRQSVHLSALLITRDTSQKFGNPEIGDKKSAHQARFPSSPINRSPNSVFSDYRQIWIIRTHRNSSESPNSVIRVTRIISIT
jgi:hypothetical protein